MFDKIAKAEMEPGGMIRRQNIRERLEVEKASLERRVIDISKALSLLDRNPDTEELMNLISR